MFELVSISHFNFVSAVCAELDILTGDITQVESISWELLGSVLTLTLIAI